jgi:hypothetical protein
MKEDIEMKIGKMATISVGAALALLFPLFIHAGDKPLKVKIQEVLSIGALDDETLFQWTGVASDFEGFIYVLDGLDYSLKKFSAKGQLVKKAGGKGQGPGEFMAPRLLGCSENFLYATDQGILGISVFDRDLRFQKRIPFSMPISDLFVISDERIAVAVIGFQDPGRVVVLDAEGKVQSELVYQKKMAGPLMDSVSATLDGQGDLYLAYVFQDKVERWNKSRTLVWSKDLLGVKKVKIEKLSGYALPTETCLKDICLDHRGHIFVLGGSRAKNPSRDVYVLSPAGGLVATLTLPDTTHCIYLDHQDFLYVRANDGITLKKYKLIYE